MLIKLLQEKYILSRYKKNLPAHIISKIEKIKKKDVVIDCGANVGLVSMIFASKGAIVYAFEPDPVAYEVLKKRSTRHININAINAAVGFEDKDRVNLYLHSNRDVDPVGFSQGSSLMNGKPNVSSRAESVRMVNLINFISKFQSVKMIKIDIEGFEVLLIPELIKSRVLDIVEYVFIEVHDKKWEELKDETDKMINECRLSNYSDKIFFDWP